MGCFLHVLKNYANFGGRASRKEYWMFTLLASVALALLISLGILTGVMMIMAGIAALVLIVPSIALSVRRLHDAGYSGWWYLLSFIPYAGFIVMLIIGLLPPTSGPNQFGGSTPKC